MGIKNILITGGAGFIGSSLAKKLSSMGYNITVVDNLSPQIHGADPELSSLYTSIKGKADFIRGDVLDVDVWRMALKNQDAVIHLAAETGTGQSMYQIDKYVNSNIRGTSFLLDMITNEKNNVSKLIVASSRAVYGEGKYQCLEHGLVYPDGRKDEDMAKRIFEPKCPICNAKIVALPTDEESPVKPKSVYGLTKYAQENMVINVGKAIGLPSVAFRFQNVFGPGQSLKNPYTGILSIFSTQLRNGDIIDIFEDGKESRDFVYIDDVVDSVILGLFNNKADYEIFNVGTGTQVDVLTVARYLSESLGCENKINISGRYRSGDIRTNFADLSKIKRLLDFSPNVTVEQGIRKFAEWVLGQSIPENKFDFAMKEMSSKGLFK
jgi:dTDP-L-rhamnose 4-epimerase